MVDEASPRGFWDWISGAARRRAESQARQADREAYLAALTAVTAASVAQADVFKEWLAMFRASSDEPVKGWINDDRRQWLEEQKEEHGLEGVIPAGLSSAEQAEWLEEHIGMIG